VGRELQLARRAGIDAQRRLDALSRVVDVGVVLLGPGGELEFANRRARELLGGGEEPVEERWAAAREQLQPALAVAAGGDVGAARRADVELQTPAGPRALRLQAYRLEEGSEGQLVLLRDRAMLEALETDLALAAQLRTLTRLYRALAHDLRAPLNSMVLHLELLRQSLAGGDDDAAARDDRQHWVQVLREELDRLNRSLRSLLAETAPARQEREEFDLRGVIEEVRSLIAPQARMQRVTVEIALPDDPLTLTGHRDRLKQAMLNVVINALEAMGEGGALRLGLEQADSHATISVRDSGPGIPAEVSARIFDLHFTTKSTGTGIGLYVARSVAEAHGGAIDVESEPGKGSTFRLRLPLIS
jgi:signal transduction histidine kinase